MWYQELICMLPYFIFKPLCPNCPLCIEEKWGINLYVSHIISSRRTKGSSRDLTCAHSIYLSHLTMIFVPWRQELVLSWGGGRRWNRSKVNTVIIGKLCPKVLVPDSFDFGFHLHCCFFKICKSQDKLNKDIDFIIAFSTYKMKFDHLILITVPSLLIAHWCVARSISFPFPVSLLLDNTSHINDFKFASSYILKMRRSRKIILVTCFI